MPIIDPKDCEIVCRLIMQGMNFHGQHQFEGMLRDLLKRLIKNVAACQTVGQAVLVLQDQREDILKAAILTYDNEPIEPAVAEMSAKLAQAFNEELQNNAKMLQFFISAGQLVQEAVKEQATKGQSS